MGWLLGITPDLFPLERAEMDEIEQLISKRNEKTSEAGTKMTGALIDLVGSFIVITPLRGVAASTTRLFIGDETADLLDMPAADWTRHLVGSMRELSSRSSWLVVHDEVMRRVVATVSRRTLSGFVDHERHGERPSFTIPDHLARSFAPGPVANGWAKVRRRS